MISSLKQAGRFETFLKFPKLITEDKFPLDNIAFLLFLGVVTWYSENNSSQMKCDISETVQFWRNGHKLFHGRFLRFMSGPKNQGQILQGVTYRGVYDLRESRINFVVPSNQVLKKLNPFQKEDLMPGIIETKLETLSMQNEGKTFRIAVDAKKNSKGRGRVLGGC